MEKKSVAVTNEKVSNYIPDEICYSILSKLPLKSLKRFQCVQKSWSLLFENHYFMNMLSNTFLSYSDPSSLILRVVENYVKVFYSFSGERFEKKVKLDWSNSYKDDPYTRVFGNVNGTLCLYTGDNGDIVLWNPATKTMKVLPDSEVQLAQSYMPCGADDYVDFDIGYYLHGFGYDHVTNDYMIIWYVDIDGELLSDEYPEDEEGILLLDWLKSIDLDSLWEIYSLRSNSWRKLYVDMPYSYESYQCTRVYIDGVCHWLCDNYETVGPCLVSFYLSNDAFFITPIPSDVDDCFSRKMSWINLAVLNGSTALISYHEEMTTFHISILGEIGTEESWTKLLIVELLSSVTRPIGMSMKGEIVFIRKDQKLVLLDLRTQMTAELDYKGDVVHLSQIIIYKESILPIEGM